MKSIKAVIIGFSHMHVNEIAKYISEADGFELAAIAKAPSDTEDIEPLFSPSSGISSGPIEACTTPHLPSESSSE